MQLQVVEWEPFSMLRGWSGLAWLGIRSMAKTPRAAASGNRQAQAS